MWGVSQILSDFNRMFRIIFGSFRDKFMPTTLVSDDAKGDEIGMYFYYLDNYGEK